MNGAGAGSGRTGRRGGLASRLSRIRGREAPGAPAPGGIVPGAPATSAPATSTPTPGTPTQSAPPPGAELPGWVRTAENVLERCTRIRAADTAQPLSGWLHLLFPSCCEQLEQYRNSDGNFSELKSKLVFFDLETTGLSHGAGTVAFMASLARYIDTEPAPGLEITQLLLSDYPGEFDFLSRFASLVGEDSPVLVSFNGRCFDSQILMTRYLMQGMRPRFLGPGTLHLDLLFPSRRLWKRELGSCTLSAIETGKLALHRENDLPGSQAPDAWFEWIRGESSSRILQVGEHNLQDCITLAQLLERLDLEISRGSGRAGLVRALDLRSQKRYAEAERFLSPLASSGDPLAQKILAIDLEHRLGNPEKALVIAQSLGDLKRTERLKRKIERLF